MNFKRILITAILVTSQVAMVLPVSAEEAVHSTTNVAEQSVNTPDSTNQNQDQLENNGTELSNESDIVEDGAEGTEGEVTPPVTEPVTEPVTNPVDPGATTAAGTGELILMMNSNKMYQNGSLFIAGNPMEVKKGVSYVAIRAIVERAGLQLSFDNKTKETIITRGSDELRFQFNKSTYKVNGVVKPMKGTSYSAKNNFMVPLTAITGALNIPYTVDQPGKRVILSLSTNPVASFSVGNKEIVAGETVVQYSTNSYSPSGLEIVEEQWEGREDTFTTPGSYLVTYRVKDSNGQWSNPFSLTLNVVKPHTPPVANFTTDKDTYKMGELINYTDFSTDEENSIKDRVWENKELAFFNPGPTTIRLKVTNKYGLYSTVEKTITITDEVLYTKDEFNKIFTPVGEKYTFDGTVIPSWTKVNYSFTSEPTTLIRSNSPETVYSEGRVYTETATGSTRFMIHHVNSTGKNVKMYVIATNKNTETTRLTQTTMGFGGPSPYATAAGRASVNRYYESLQTGKDYKDVWIAPGESKIVMTELNANPMKPGEVISLYSDLYSDHTLQYDVIMIDANKDPFKTLPTLDLLAADVHNRGTYMDANRNIEYNELVGDSPVRLMIADNSTDPFQIGTGPQGEYQMNSGNFGVVYKIKLYRVAPNTLITFNPRGGRYYGSMMVNGEIVQLSSSGSLSAPNENSVLFRSGDREQTVEFTFTAAPGSNLSVNLLLQPLPEIKH
ncbi:copper amine oxidase N-terminal domain-containing protein [Paenibacillus sp. FSL K6-2524]|uniref:copper amine oxidase N-terminal domain-containing protein n=1 Tax=Paenibacillus sp. FSL K6-2524 TaxID=2954516 RepID=UPI0030F64BDC